MGLLNNHRFKVLSGLVISLLAIGTIFYHYVEEFVWVDSFYFAAITLTTVGYGDFAPATTFGKIFTVAYLFFGIGIILSFVNMIAKQRIRRRLYEKGTLKSDKEGLELKLKKLKKKIKNKKRR